MSNILTWMNDIFAVFGGFSVVSVIVAFIFKERFKHFLTGKLAEKQNKLQKELEQFKTENDKNLKSYQGKIDKYLNDKQTELNHTYSIKLEEYRKSITGFNKFLDKKYEVYPEIMELLQNLRETIFYFHKNIDELIPCTIDERSSRFRILRKGAQEVFKNYVIDKELFDTMIEQNLISSAVGRWLTEIIRVMQLNFDSAKSKKQIFFSPQINSMIDKYIGYVWLELFCAFKQLIAASSDSSLFRPEDIKRDREILKRVEDKIYNLLACEREKFNEIITQMQTELQNPPTINTQN